MNDKGKKHDRVWIFLAGVLAGSIITGLAVFLINRYAAGYIPVTLERTQTPDETVTASDVPESSLPPEETEQGGQADTDHTIWTVDGVYLGGNEVLYENGIFRARWWTQGEAPNRSGDGVWEYIGELPEEDVRQEEIDPEEESSVPETSVPTTNTEIINSNKGMKVVAYYPSWKPGERNLEKLRFDIITHVNYAFAIPTAEGALRPLEDPELARAVIQKAHDNGAKALIAVGGWSYQDVPLESTFMEATETDEKIEKLGDAILELCEEYGFDGVDMDWEHPRQDGTSKAQYEKLMVYLGEKLHAQGKLLTSAVLSGVTADGLVYYDSAAHTDTVLDTVDWINVMAYDGGDGERHSSYDFAVNCGQYWKDTRGMEKSKVVLGVPFYARPSWAGYEQLLETDGSAWEKDVISFYGVEAWYNGVETIEEKTVYAKENLGGIMIWEITQDTSEKDRSLLSAIGKQVK